MSVTGLTQLPPSDDTKLPHSTFVTLPNHLRTCAGTNAGTNACQIGVRIAASDTQWYFCIFDIHGICMIHMGFAY